MKQDKMRLFLSAFVKVVLGVALIGILLFLPAGTLAFAGAWRLFAALFIPMLVMGVVMLIFSPELLRRRLASKEERSTQQGVVRYTGLLFIISFVVAGLDFRFGWLPLPGWVNWAAAVVFLVAYLLYAEVLRENTYLSRTIEVQESQTVVDTGLYGIVRHPMYAVTLLLFLSMPFVLGSFLSFLCFLPYPFLIAKRLLHEEAFLEQELTGYKEYKEKVKYRLIAGIW